jgi:hypothetical protein
MRSSLVFFAIFALACESDSGLQHVADRYGTGEGALSGRVCDPERYVWLEGASVYTHVIDSSGELRDTRTTLSDADGSWLLDNLADGTYEVYVQYGSATLDIFQATVKNGSETVVPQTDCSGSADVEVAVVTGDFDEFDKVLEAAGIGGYHLVNGQTGDELLQFLSNADEMATYDAIFFAGGHLEDGIFYSLDGSASEASAAVRDRIKEYVKDGGVVFASDWSYDVVEQTWPDQIEFAGDDSTPDSAQIGEIGNLSAEVSNSTLEDELGSDSVKMNLDLDAWPVVTGVDEEAKVFLRADAPWRQGMETGEESNSPLIVEFESGKGKVVFTPWRMSANIEGKQLKVVRWLFDREL